MDDGPGIPALDQGELADLMADGAELRVLDVRRRPAFERDPVVIPGAERVPPEEVVEWAKNNAAARSAEVVVYCVLGHEVSQAAATTLRESGFNVRFLSGGLCEWQKQGRRTDPP